MLDALKRFLLVAAATSVAIAVSAPPAFATYDWVPFSPPSRPVGAAGGHLAASGGFAWGDAALGAAAVLAAAAVGAAVMLVARRGTSPKRRLRRE
ncbi:MAG TPA: hypothetical protein VHA76_04010 [Solirubrobacterales bacterium]|nr:hypothetical protein [Solirubrobacterales bacterium]